MVRDGGFADASKQGAYYGHSNQNQVWEISLNLKQTQYKLELLKQVEKLKLLLPRCMK